MAPACAIKTLFSALTQGVDREVRQHTRHILLLASRAALHQRHERRDGARLRDQDLVLGVVGREAPQRTRRVLLLALRAALHQRHERRDGASLRDQ